MIRRDLGDNVIEVLHNTGTERWLVVKKQLEAARVRNLCLADFVTCLCLRERVGSEVSLTSVRRGEWREG